MDSVVEVTGGKGGNAYLISGKDKTALMDCGMAYCAPQLIGNIRRTLDGRPLNYILISHSHYDHVGALPYLKQAWPDSIALGAEHAKHILSRENALNTIRSLSKQAAIIYKQGDIQLYDDRLMKVDQVIQDGDPVELGGVNVRVLETTGHTKCSLSFLLNREILFASESTGCMNKAGNISPAFITSASEAISSIRKCQKLNPRFIISPHFGLINEAAARDYWQNCIRAVKKISQFIRILAAREYTEADILIAYDKAFRDEQSRAEQPFDAFRLNNERMIQTVLQFGDGFT